MCTACCCASNRECKHQLCVSQIQSSVVCSSRRKQWVWIPSALRSQPFFLQHKPSSTLVLLQTRRSRSPTVFQSCRKNQWCQRQRVQAINYKSALCWEFRCLRVSQSALNGRFCMCTDTLHFPVLGMKTTERCTGSYSQFEASPGYALPKWASLNHTGR